MIVRLMAATVAVALAAQVVPAQDNPFKSVAVNDFATYRMKLSIGVLNLDGATTQLVTKKTDKEATIRVTATFSGMETPPQEETIDLTKPYDPTRVGMLPQGADAKIEKLKDGEETIKVGKDLEGKDKEYVCSWTTYKVTAKAANQTIEANVKVWQDKENKVKMGLVRMELTGKVMNAADPASAVDTKMVLEIIEWGTKKE